MGNYKTGHLNLTLKENTPMEIILLLADLASYDDDRLPNSNFRKERIEKLKNKNNHEIFNSLYLDYLILDSSEDINFEIQNPDGKFRWYNFNGYKANILLEESGLEKNFENFEKFYCQTLDEDIRYQESIQYISQHKFRKINFYFSHGSKYYDNEFDKIFNFLKPYIEETEECLGEIRDEDGYLGKDYYLHETTFKKIITKQKYMCEGCPNKFGRKDNVKCENYEFCSIAYDNGQKYKKD